MNHRPGASTWAQEKAPGAAVGKAAGAFLDPALIEAARAGTLPRVYGVTRFMNLPPIFANQWQALGLSRPV